MASPERSRSRSRPNPPDSLPRVSSLPINDRPAWNPDVRLDGAERPRSIFSQEAMPPLRPGGRRGNSPQKSSDRRSVKSAVGAYKTLPFILDPPRTTSPSRKSPLPKISSKKSTTSKRDDEMEYLKSVYTQKLTNFNYIVDEEYLTSITQTLTVTPDTEGGGKAGPVDKSVTEREKLKETQPMSTVDSHSENTTASPKTAAKENSQEQTKPQPLAAKDSDDAHSTGHSAEAERESASAHEEGAAAAETSGSSTGAQEKPSDEAKGSSAPPSADDGSTVHTHAITVEEEEEEADDSGNHGGIDAEALSAMAAVGLSPSPSLNAHAPSAPPKDVDPVKASLFSAGTVVTPTTKRKETPIQDPEPQNLFGVSPTPSRKLLEESGKVNVFGSGKIA